MLKFTQLLYRGAWFFYNGDGSLSKQIWTRGVAGDLPVPADGVNDVVVFRNGGWLFLILPQGGHTNAVVYGPGCRRTIGATPVPADGLRWEWD